MAFNRRLSFLESTVGITFCLVAASCNNQGTEPTGPLVAPAESDIAERFIDPLSDDPNIDPASWPLADAVFEADKATEKKIADLLSRMTLEEKVGQIVQADIGSVTPEEVKEYNLGSILNGGNSAPGADNRTTPDAWLALADAFWEASTDRSDGGVGIPALWGSDAVHGHNNVVGATLFPHNIGLGAAGDPDLIEKIGEVTAREMLATGLDWTFAPTIAVVRNDRWGRTYESYSENPELVASYATRIVEGIQGAVSSPEFLGRGKIVATAKHFVADGGTVDGRDQGDSQDLESTLRDIHAAGYPAAIDAGVQVVMASFSSYKGRKLHGHRELLTDVLRGRMNFDGFVVGDWNGHGQVAGCTNTSCAAAINAGVDMFMAPDSWKKLYENTLAQARSGEISAERLDEAVSRILRVKIRAGLFEAGPPSSRALAGDWTILSDPDHKAVARAAVRQSLVLLKNNDDVLPIQPGARVLVTGDGADNIAKQSGGWTLSWQGTGNANKDFPNGQSIYAGLREAIEEIGGETMLSADGSYTEKPDIAIIVFGEDPYAEFQGDVAHLDFVPTEPLEKLKAFRDAGVKTVSVFLSGRPMWVNPELNASDGFVAAWLPGDQGAGVADVLVGDQKGAARHDFSGRLSFSWPKLATDAELNAGAANYDPLFPIGYGLEYAAPKAVQIVSEESGLTESQINSFENFIIAGDAASPWRMAVTDTGGSTQISDTVTRSASGGFVAISADVNAQEDTRIFRWTDPATLVVDGNTVDFSRQSNADMAIEFAFSVPLSEASVASTAVTFAMGCGGDCEGALDLTESIFNLRGAGWVTRAIKLSCLAEAGADMTAISQPLIIRADGPFEIQIASTRLVSNTGDARCTF